MISEQVIVFTDLDGTLLDHFTYQATAALSTIKQLQKANIPIIINTSKTLAELDIINKVLGINTPFIIENGAAIYMPKSSFSHQPIGTVEVGDYWVKSFSLPRQHWVNVIKNNTVDFKAFYQGFSTLSAQQLSEMTGLTIAEAKRAKLREFGEPIHWLGDQKSKNKFIDILLSFGANVLEGGRFIHISDHCDKGQALVWLTNQYQVNNPNMSLRTIALGDGNNDIAMLEVADIAVQVRSPVHEFPLLERQKNTMKTEKFGPVGWAAAIQALLFQQTSFTSLTKEVNHG